MSDEVVEGAAELRTEMSKVNSGSKREAELQQQLNALYQRAHAPGGAAPPTPMPRPDGYATLPPSAPPRDFLAERIPIRAEMQKPFADPNLQDKLDESYRDEDAALASAAPEPPPSPDMLEWPAGVEEGVKNGFCALALQYDIPASEAQTAVRELTNITPMSADPDAARPLLRREFGAALPSVLAHAEAVFGELPPKLQTIIQEPEVFFSPPVLKRLEWLWQRSRSGGT
ncbi:MAG TPA: hypothetical protein VGQ73_04350 [Gemmatimonadales bacterium]|jgi:hypothetical protein|nr:hypothetical protein [Gemmatimonadales bacterium]